MFESQSRTQRFRGRSPSDRNDDWQVTTVARRSTNKSGSLCCHRCDRPLDESHFYVTLRRPTRSPTRPPEFDHLVVHDGALDELDAWLE